MSTCAYIIARRPAGQTGADNMAHAPKCWRMNLSLQLRTDPRLAAARATKPGCAGWGSEHSEPAQAGLSSLAEGFLAPQGLRAANLSFAASDDSFASDHRDRSGPGRRPPGSRAGGVAHGRRPQALNSTGML